jgi:hypothetical protein
MGLRGWVKRLERDARGYTIEIPQKDGTVRRFPQSAGVEAFANLMDRMGAGGDAPPEHPLLAAARTSSAPEWAESVYAVDDPDAWTAPIEDLSG